MELGWNTGCDDTLIRIAEIATGSSGLRMFSAGARLSLALPSDSSAAHTVIDLYQPQRVKGRIFRAVARFSVFTGFARRHPSFFGPQSSLPQVRWLRGAAEAGTVGFMGCNPAHGWRCVLSGIDPATGSGFVAKLGLDESAEAVRTEDKTLRVLHSRFPGIVQSLGCENGTDWALLRLPHLGNISPMTMADPQIGKLLVSWLGDCWDPLSGNFWAMELLERLDSSLVPKGWHDRMRSYQVRHALIHGDFAVWNLRATNDGLCAIDLEWANENGIGGVDLAHGLRQECYMVRGMKPERAVAWMLEQAASPIWSRYLDSCGWGQDHRDWLRIGLLHSHFNAKNDSTELLAALDIHL
jgi:hypothetical protein